MVCVGFRVVGGLVGRGGREIFYRKKAFLLLVFDEGVLGWLGVDGLLV